MSANRPIMDSVLDFVSAKLVVSGKPAHLLSSIYEPTHRNHTILEPATWYPYLII